MFDLATVVPWGRSFEEYCAMFALTGRDLEGRMLGCGDGPASFNAGATRRLASVVSCDPLYRHSADDIRRRIDETCETVLAQTRANEHEFVWDTIRSVEELGRVRRRAMEEFLADYPAGRDEGRYVTGELPSLPFANGSFDLAVCSHLLFLYTQQLGEAFHHAAVLDLCRVAREVRIFPLLALGGSPSPFVDSCRALMNERGRTVSIEPVPYEFQRGAHEMMRITMPD